MIKKLGAYFFVICLLIVTLSQVDYEKVFAANIGGTVSAAEQGWRRYGNNSGYFSLQGSWVYGAGQDYYTTSSSSKLKFYFYGSKLRFYSFSWGNHTQNARINIDGVEYQFRNTNYSTGRYYVLDFDINNLPEKMHEVNVYKAYNDSSVLSFSGIDIDNNGYMVTCDSTKLNLESSSMTIEDGKTTKLNFQVTNFKSSEVRWTSSDEHIVSVDDYGNLYGVKAGNAVVTAYIPGTSLRAVCNITVKETILKLKAELNKVNYNDTFSVNLIVDNVSYIESVLANIIYDTSKLQLLDIKPSEDTMFLKKLNHKGKVILDAFKKSETSRFNEGQTVAVIKFKSIAKGNTLMNIDKGSISGNKYIKHLNKDKCGEQIISII